MIEVQELTKTYRHLTAVERLSFRADPRLSAIALGVEQRRDVD